MSAEELRELAKTLIGIADGKPWQFYDFESEKWDDAGESADAIGTVQVGGKIRLKPRELGRTVNGHTLPEGASWHRIDGWTKDMLPAGMRPLMFGERIQKDDEKLSSDTFNKWFKFSHEGVPLDNKSRHMRTTRPIPFALTPEKIADGWLPWSGGECQVEPESLPKMMLKNGDILEGVPANNLLARATDSIVAYKPDPYGRLRQALADGKTIEYQPSIGSRWHQIDKGMEIGFIAPPEFYRIKEPQWLPLGPEDFPPLSMIRRKNQTDEYGKPQYWHWRLISYVTRIGPVCANRGYNWQELSTDYEINRPRHRDADGNPTLWEPCMKQAP